MREIRGPDGRVYVEAPWKTCRECGERYQLGARWHNAFLCSPGCCAVVWARNHPQREEDEEFY